MSVYEISRDTGSVPLTLLGIDIQDDSITSVAQLQALIKAAEALGVETVKRKNSMVEVYGWMNDILLRLKYRSLRKKEKGIVRKYLRLYSGYAESHIDHLISMYAIEGKIKRRPRTQPVFPTTYTGKGTDPYVMGPKGSKMEWSDEEVIREELSRLY
ncbi:MAG: hypothetical protein A2W52_03120 [Candidatus Taylorbacteria bacterium RIFCSPHIGHO2_02_49_25]|uniref:Uncharacterized protein n=1 Tax=Candidatus Taylorbacteria bacterium RIFCSPHIGHO2_02_49_25 TaxID=1802305 RepID=A0A1G2MG70_9BACT|nr:MAG: hypothetical protein UY62_C0011G0012 [Parcubacteria group bacterium GW2011_GWF2_50_9]OHA19840.1 MAG: hypothetical protein A2759_04275 [Candidatus Taylorbacteria bacterium RIFCSPHIGHO2_01_FULL_49_60]OHA22877.1 MAG: hypothetical protein A2W52_03120 [Candidatus Taylorbacteria bacterium RIFCSPHIGHO2_02_49_25]OHA36307.1 MAG: hypothetical protein A2W65_01440 [Candidatus Taylorbacteria bacterium RIFCSPLOWO2_02_50_13]OHA41006.1 MAG: hypothetical protein A3H73_02630 [Candidatus Taylorbacteria ba